MTGPTGMVEALRPQIDEEPKVHGRPWRPLKRPSPHRRAPYALTDATPGTDQSRARSLIT